MRLLFLFCLLSPMNACTSTVEDRREKSPNYKDGVFFNVIKGEGQSFWRYFKMRFTTDYAEWPDWVEVPLGAKPNEKVFGDEVRVTFINHATFLIQTGGYNILTDPIYSKRASPLSFYGYKRVHRPAIAFNDLPKIDIVLISHDHYDHLDLDTITKIIKRDNPKIYTGLRVKKHIEVKKNVFELDWWKSAKISDSFKLTFVEVQHFSGRSYFDFNTTLWGGFVLEIGSKKIYFGGDSGYGPHYKKTYEKFGKMDLAFLPIGAYAPRYFMGHAHLDPKQAVQAHIDLKSGKSIGMHYGTFPVSAEPREEPEQLLKQETMQAQLKATDFITLELGESYLVD